MIQSEADDLAKPNEPVAAVNDMLTELRKEIEPSHPEKEEEEAVAKRDFIDMIE